jgi:hypothetical protein
MRTWVVSEPGWGLEPGGFIGGATSAKTVDGKANKIRVRVRRAKEIHFMFSPLACLAAWVGYNSLVNLGLIPTLSLKKAFMVVMSASMSSVNVKVGPMPVVFVRLST